KAAVIIGFSSAVATLFMALDTIFIHLKTGLTPLNEYAAGTVLPGFAQTLKLWQVLGLRFLSCIAGSLIITAICLALSRFLKKSIFLMLGVLALVAVFTLISAFSKVFLAFDVSQFFSYNIFGYNFFNIAAQSIAIIALSLFISRDRV
ncbi:MAG: hypothetical protein ACI4QR_03100, partial [Eubacteriales bacterium]